MGSSRELSQAASGARGSTAEHTPWIVSAVRTKMDGQIWYRIVGDSGAREMAYVPFGDRTQAEDVECTKHARLIAAAPDLLDALQNLLAVHEGDGGTRYHAGDIARAAIAKATGQ